MTDEKFNIIVRLIETQGKQIDDLKGELRDLRLEVKTDLKNVRDEIKDVRDEIKDLRDETRGIRRDMREYEEKMNNYRIHWSWKFATSCIFLSSLGAFFLIKIVEAFYG